MNLREQIKARELSRFQTRAITLCFLLNMVDGYDVLVMAFTAPSVSKHWDLSSVYVGYLLSSSLFGMALGAFLLAPLADRFGRRNLVLSSLAITTIGMAIATFASSPDVLLASRVFAGLGIGAMVANITVLVNEYSNDAKRGLTVGLFATGYPLGATIGGLIASVLISNFGWRAAFAFGGVVTLLLLLWSLRALPESYDYLLSRRKVSSLDQLNAILEKMGMSRQAELPAAVEKTEHNGLRSSLKEIFGRGVLPQTLLAWLGYALMTASFYFATSWTTKIVAKLSDNDNLGIATNILYNLGGAVGAALFGLFSLRVPVRKLLIALMLSAALFYALFGVAISQVYLAMCVGVLAGMAVTAAISAVYVLGPSLYTTRSRGTGFGLLMGIGRAASLLAPIIVGYLLDGGMKPSTVFQLFAVPLVIAAAAFYFLGVYRRKQGLSPEPVRPETAPATH